MAISILAGGLAYKKLGEPTRQVFLMVVLALITEILGILVAKLNPTHNNMLVFYIANPIEFALIISFYIKAINNRTAKYTGAGLISSYILVSLLNILLLHQHPDTSFYFTIAKGLGITTFSLWYLTSIFTVSDTYLEIKISQLVITIGLLFFYSFSAIYFSIYVFEVYDGGNLSLLKQIRPLLFIVYMVLQLSILLTFIQILRNKW